MRLTKIATAGAAVLSLVSVPALAAPVQTAASGKTVKANVRHAGKLRDGNKASSEGYIIAALALTAVIGGVIAATTNSKETPRSP
jgi:hypothetical protein